MRTLLTYVLAALAAGACVTLALGGVHYADLVAGIADGRYRAIAAFNPLIEFGFRAAGYFLSLGIPTLLMARFKPEVLSRKSFTAWLIIGLMMAAMGFGAVYLGMGIVSGVAAAMEPLKSYSVWLELVLAGLAWGAVFWIRAPKPTAAGIAA